MVWMTTLTSESSYAGGLLPGLVLLALGIGHAFVPLTLTATTNLGAEDQGVASGLFNTAQQVGGALGLAILSTVATRATETSFGTGSSRPDALVEGFTSAFAVGAGMLIAGALVTMALLRRADVAKVSTEAVPVPA
jgi:hypothetical protein